MYYFYILKCKDGSFYCGSTNNLKHRELLHNSGKGSKYVRSRGGGKIIYSEGFRTLSNALKREAEVKKLSRKEKMALINNRSNKRLLRPSRSPGARNGKFAALFDMDGVLINNIRFHFKAYQVMVKPLGLKVSYAEFLRNISGRKNIVNFEYVLKRKLTQDEARHLAEKKEAIYRKLYRPHIKPVAGLMKFLQTLKREKVPVVLATFGPAKNVNFIFRSLGLRKYFPKVLNSSHVKDGKPHPQIYLKAARLAKTTPANCLVFEDAFNGIEAAKRAGMKVVGVSTSHARSDLKHTDLVIKNFSGLTVARLQNLFHH